MVAIIAWVDSICGRKLGLFGASRETGYQSPSMPDRRDPHWQEFREWRRGNRGLGQETLSDEQLERYPLEILEAVVSLNRLIERLGDDPMCRELAGLRKAVDRFGARMARRSVSD
jgi:hypothetical protein